MVKDRWASKMTQCGNFTHYVIWKFQIFEKKSKFRLWNIGRNFDEISNRENLKKT